MKTLIWTEENTIEEVTIPLIEEFDIDTKLQYYKEIIL